MPMLTDAWLADRAFLDLADLGLWGILPGSLTSVLFLGHSTEAAVGTALAVTALGMFGHTNVRTPRWLGYLVARPESHMLHHARGVHRANYADLPVIDMNVPSDLEAARSPPRRGRSSTRAPRRACAARSTFASCAIAGSRARFPGPRGDEPRVLTRTTPASPRRPRPRDRPTPSGRRGRGARSPARRRQSPAASSVRRSRAALCPSGKRAK